MLNVDEDKFALEKKFFSEELFILNESGAITGEALHKAYRVWAAFFKLPAMKYETFKARIRDFLDSQESKDHFQGEVKWHSTFPGIKTGAVQGLSIIKKRLFEMRDQIDVQDVQEVQDIQEVQEPEANG